MQWSISRLRSLQLSDENWELFQRLLMLSVTPEPACLPFVLTQIINRKADKPIQEHASLKHSSEVANVLWGCLALGLTLNNDTVDKVSQCRVPVLHY